MFSAPVGNPSPYLILHIAFDAGRFSRFSTRIILITIIINVVCLCTLFLRDFAHCLFPQSLSATPCQGPIIAIPIESAPYSFQLLHRMYFNDIILGLST